MTTPAPPIITNPGVSGQLSNKRGANTGADLIALAAKYSNPRASGDLAGTVRIVATKPTSPGSSVTQTALDTGHLGTGNASGLPKVLDVWPTARFVYDPGSGPRVYVAHGSTRAIPAVDSQIYSAPINGPNIGTWRAETPLPPEAMINGIHSMVQAQGYVYVSQTTFVVEDGNVRYAKINADGTIGTWNVIVASWLPYGAAAGELATYTDSTGTYLFGFHAGAGIPGTGTWSTQINADGTFNGGGIGTALPAARIGCSIFIDTKGKNNGTATIYLIGGNLVTGTSSRADIASVPITAGKTIGAWATSGAVLPVSRTYAALAVIPLPISGSTWLYLIGGNNLGGVTQSASGSTTIYRVQATNLPGTVWTIDAAVLPAVQSGGGGVASSIFGATAGQSQLFTFGAGVTAGGTTNTLIVRVSNATFAVAGVTGSYGTGNLLVSGDLGAGGSITNNVDGSQSIIYAWQAGAIGGVTLVDGDVVTISVQFADSQGGDPSPTTLSTFKVGQPPTISNVSPAGAITNRQPPVSFNFTAGAGGGSEYKYQIQIKDNGGNIVADTGLIAGNANTFSPKLYPMLASALAASTVITVYSTDNPMSGSTNSATVTTAFTPTQAAPSVPTSGGVTVDNVGGAVIPNWTNPIGGVAPTFNRLWWALAASSTWLIAKDLIVPNAQGSVNSYTLMDTIPLGTSVKIGVSSLVGASPGTGESAVTFLGTVTINPDYHQDLGGYTAMLHVVGNGPNQRVPLPNIPPITFDTHVDVGSTIMFGGLAPSYRYGPYLYREISINVIPLDSQITALDAVLAAAQAGAILCYRDTVGTLIYCGIQTDRSRKKDLYYADTLKLTEVQYTFVP